MKTATGALESAPVTFLERQCEDTKKSSIPNFKSIIERRRTLEYQEKRRQKIAAQVEKHTCLMEKEAAVPVNDKRFLANAEIEAGIKPLPKQDASVKMKYLSSLIDLSIDVPEPVSVLKHSDKVIFSRGNISVIGGKAKSKKTFLIVLLAAEFLENDKNEKLGDYFDEYCRIPWKLEDGTIEYYNSYGSVLIVDTEMAISNTAKTARRIHKLMGWNTKYNNKRLTILSLREYATIDRVAIFKEAIENIRPELIFLDGIRDLVRDFNNIDESNQIVCELMQLSTRYDCHICSVLHENKGNRDLRGHLGTEIINKSESVLTVVANEEGSTVKPEFTRNIPFEEFTFRINDDGLPEYCDAPVSSSKDDKLRQLLENIFSNGKALSYTDLGKKIAEAEKISVSMANKRIAYAIKMKMLIKNSKGFYSLNTVS